MSTPVIFTWESPPPPPPPWGNCVITITNSSKLSVFYLKSQVYLYLIYHLQNQTPKKLYSLQGSGTFDYGKN